MEMFKLDHGDDCMSACIYPKFTSLDALSGWILLHEKYALIKVFVSKTLMRGKVNGINSG